MIRPDIVAAFRLQAQWCETLGSPFTAGVMRQAAEALGRDGALTRVLADWPGDPVPGALALRVAGALHRQVLTGRDAALAASYPGADGPGPPEAAWTAAEAMIARDPAAFRAELDSPPQTNETRRSLGLGSGLLLLADRFGLPIDLYELGASAGLNLLMDRFAYRTDSWAWNEEGQVRIEGAWEGAPPPLGRSPDVLGRFGCDRNPLDAGNEADRLRLRSFVWADQFDRMARLEAALDLAAAEGPRVDRADAATWLAERLPQRSPGRLSVVFHSVFWQYPPEATRAEIRRLMLEAGAAADAASPLAWLRLEPAEGAEGSRPGGHLLDLTVWPGGRRDVLADVDPHGRSVRWRL